MGKPIIGLSGGIGSGKSTVAELLAEHRVAVINADELNNRQLCSPEVSEELRRWWGESVWSESEGLDRKRIAEVIFGDPRERKRLEALLHPRIAEERERLIELYEADDEIQGIVLDTPLLFESGLQQRCDVVVFVEADDAIRRRRVMSIRGWSDRDWFMREKSQMALDNKRQNADHVLVNNSSDIDQLRPAVNDLLDNILRDTRTRPLNIQ